MRGAIYAKSEEKARSKLLDIAYKYKFYQISKIKEQHSTKNELLIIFENGDIWRAFKHNGSNSCGRRYNIIYIDNNFSADEKLLIRTCATLPPYTGITYFN